MAYRAYEKARQINRRIRIIHKAWPQKETNSSLRPRCYYIASDASSFPPRESRVEAPRFLILQFFRPFFFKQVAHNIHFHKARTLFLSLTTEIANTILLVDHSIRKQLAQCSQQKLVAVALHRHINGVDAVADCQVSYGIGFVSNGKHVRRRAETRNQARRAPRITIHNNSPQIHLVRCRYTLLR